MLSRMVLLPRPLEPVIATSSASPASCSKSSLSSSRPRPSRMPRKPLRVSTRGCIVSPEREGPIRLSPAAFFPSPPLRRQTKQRAKDLLGPSPWREPRTAGRLIWLPNARTREGLVKVPKLVASAVAALLSVSVWAQTIPLPPTFKVGDSWTVRVTDALNDGQNRVRNATLKVERIAEGRVELVAHGPESTGLSRVLTMDGNVVRRGATDFEPE